jgi:NAD(P)-dependent dehydrogenase (short-subunit alcohol dehydrogenase family)
VTDEAKRVVVTGGGKGLGAAIVEALAAGGFDVDFTYRSSADEAKALADKLMAEHAGRAVTPIHADLGERDAVEALADKLTETPPYGLVHNAGQSYDALTAMMDQDKAEAAMQVNFWAFTRLAKGIVRAMMRARQGRVVAIGSVAALRGNPGNAAYAASKGALISYCKTLAVEAARRGVTVNVIAPGFVDTAMLAPYADYRERMEAQIPAGRFGRPEEVASLAAYLMGEGAAYVTGAVLPVDGGLAAQLGIHR